MVTLKVAATTKVSDAAGAIAGHLRDHRVVQLQAIGAAAVNQAVKALALAELYLLAEGQCVASRVRLVPAQIGKRESTAVQWLAWRSEAPKVERVER